MAELAKDNAAFFFIQTLIKNTKGEELVSGNSFSYLTLSNGFLSGNRYYG